MVSRSCQRGGLRVAVAGLVVLAACTSGDSVPDPVPRTTVAPTTTTAAEVTVRGVVAGVFASARVVQLVPPVNGIANVALSTDTEIVRANGVRAALTDVMPGSTIEVVGRPSTAGTVVARKLTLL